ncbi:hypothetical protein HMSSN036_76850 [Paenibacillus macerans]|nr:hypothetical protein HMSSN036_76850 [Paenibacillus macerans]
METIYRQLDVVRRRIRRFRGLDGLRYGLLTGLAAALVWLAAGRLWPLEYGKIAAAASLILCTAGGWVWGRLRRVSVILAAQTMDRPEAGQERLDLMTTALAYAKLQTFPAQLEREQAEEYGAAYVRDIKQRLPLPRAAYGGFPPCLAFWPLCCWLSCRIRWISGSPRRERSGHGSMRRRKRRTGRLPNWTA